MIGARRAARRVAGMMVPRTTEKMRRNEVYRWTNRLIWLAIMLMAALAVLFYTPV